jgi:hypothetical protein
VVVNMTGASTIRKKLLIPESALQSYMAAVSAEALDAIDQQSLAPAGIYAHHSLLRIYAADGKFVQRVFNPTRVLPKQLTDQITPLRDLLRAISEDRGVDVQRGRIRAESGRRARRRRPESLSRPARRRRRQRRRAQMPRRPDHDLRREEGLASVFRWAARSEE